MPRCRYCREWLPADHERAGARCPYCREPLYEAPRHVRHYDGATTESGGVCAVHAANVAVGTCQRCGNYLCDVCRTRWRGRAICIACVSRALEDREAAPHETRAHLRQGILAVVFGVLAWTFTILIFLLALLAGEMSEGVLIALVFLMLFLFPGSLLLGALGVGHGAAAIRARGNHMILATIGLLISGLHVGILIGLLTIQVFRDG